MLVWEQNLEAVPELHAITCWLLIVCYRFLSETDVFDSLNWVRAL